MMKRLTAWLQRGWRATRHAAVLPDIPQALWQDVVQRHAFLQALPPEALSRLRTLCAHFLQQKRFHGAHGLEVTDLMALDIAAQACVLLLYLGAPEQALRWYDDFVGIVVHPGDAVARRQMVDDAGVVHHFDEVLMGEVMEGGPIMLSWAALQPGHPDLGESANVVIHEFAHKLDLRDGHANGCPPLPLPFLGHTRAADALAAWRAIWLPAFEQFRETVIRHERFGGPAPWLDSYAAEDPGEFFAVACEGYWVQRERLRDDMPAVVQALDAFFQRPPLDAAAMKVQ